MKISKKKSNIIVIFLVTIIFIVLFYYSPFRSAINAQYSHTKECTVESAKVNKTSSSKPKYKRSDAQYITISTSDCGSLDLDGKFVKGGEYENTVSHLNALKGHQVGFNFGPLSRGIFSWQITGIMFPENGPEF